MSSCFYTSIQDASCSYRILNYTPSTTRARTGRYSTYTRSVNTYNRSTYNTYTRSVNTPAKSILPPFLAVLAIDDAHRGTKRAKTTQYTDLSRYQMLWLIQHNQQQHRQPPPDPAGHGGRGRFRWWHAASPPAAGPRRKDNGGGVSGPSRPRSRLGLVDGLFFLLFFRYRFS
jgi:hypothetical protein